jgi:E3 ubiquitin-protein ligase BAH
VKLQRRKEKHCPMCRSDALANVSAGSLPRPYTLGVKADKRTANLDCKLENFLRKHFPREAKEKEMANEVERGIEIYGPGYRNQECCVM